MTRDSFVTTFGPPYRWNNPSDLIDITHQLRDRFDLETGFHKESDVVHDDHENNAQGSFVNHESCHRVVTPNGTPPSTTVVRGLEVRQEHEWEEQDPSPTSVQSDLNTLPKVHTKGFPIPSKRRFGFPLDTNDAVVLPTHDDAFSIDLFWDGGLLVDNKQSLHDDECWIRLEEGLQFFGRQPGPTAAT